MNIIDGYNGGVAHITAEMIRDHNISMYGVEDCVAAVGNEFAFEIVNNNTVTIKDGLAIIGGARVSIGYGQIENMTITNGTMGYKRNDIVVIEYSKDNVTLKETATLKVVKGELSPDTAVDPQLVTGDIRAGASKHQMALYRVMLNGLNIESVVPMFKKMPTINDIAADYIVERGFVESEGWHYEKWKSGKVRAWARVIHNLTTSNTAFVNGLYYKDVTQPVSALCDALGVETLSGKNTVINGLFAGNDGSGYGTVWRLSYNAGNKVISNRIVSNSAGALGANSVVHYQLDSII